jgi:hypothetical protein
LRVPPPGMERGIEESQAALVSLFGLSASSAMSPSCVARASQLHADTVTAVWSRSLSLSFSRHLGVGGGRERLGPRVLLRSCSLDTVSEVSTIIMYRRSDSASTSSATLQLRIRRCRLAVLRVTSTTEDPLLATHVLVEPLLVSRSPRPAAQSDSVLPHVFVRLSPHCEERALKSPGAAATARATSLSRIVWKSRSCARLDFPKLHWSMRLNLLRQLYGLLPAIYRCCCCSWCCSFGGDSGGGASLCSFRGGWFAEECFFLGRPPCLWRRACRPSHPMVGGCQEPFAQGAYGCGGGILLHGVRFRRTCSTGALVRQWTRMWLVRVLALGICSTGAASLGSR